MIDVLIFVVGYEKRSSLVSREQMARKTVAIAFTEKKLHSYDDNLRSAKKLNAELIKSDDVSERLQETLRRIVAEFSRPESSDEDVVTVGVDVSSMTRTLMAQVLRACFKIASEDNPFVLRILYATADYEPPVTSLDPFIEFGPLDGFEGWTSFPENPLAVILGLGYEVDQALAALEYLDPSGAWAFIAVGDDKRFRRDVDESNESLWPLIPERHRLEYRIDCPQAVFVEIAGLTEVLSKRARLIVPGGPKIFSALAMLVAYRCGNEVSVWRASSHDYSEIRDQTPTGKIIEFDYPLGPTSFG